MNRLRTIRAWLDGDDGNGSRLVAKATLLVAAFVVVKTAAERFFFLPTESFSSFFLLGEAFGQLIHGRLKAVVLLGVLAVFVGGCAAAARWGQRSLLLRWKELENGRSLRLVVGVAACLVTWYLVAAAPNHWSGQSYPLDRLLLLLACGVALVRPIGTLAVGMLCMPLIYQLFQPFGGYSAAEIDLPIYALLLTGVATALQAASGIRFGRPLVFVFLCLVGANYWIPGLGKLSAAWIVDDQLRFLLPATYLNGWMGHLTPAEIGELTASIAPLNVPMKAVALTLEVGMLFLLLHRRWLKLLVPSVMVFHVGMFLLAGIAFWKWMTLEAALVFVMFRHPELLSDTLFRKRTAAFSVVLILASPYWCNPPNLAWHDSRVSTTYRIDGIGESGARYALQASFFEPYRYAFTMTPFAFLDPEPVLPVTWGASSAGGAAKLNTARTAADVEALRQSIGKVRYLPNRSAKFDSLVRGYLQRATVADEWWRPLRAPAHLWTLTAPDAYRKDEPLVAAEVICETSLYVEGRFVVVSERTVRRIDANL